MTSWTGVWAGLDIGIGKIGQRYRQSWAGVWTIWTGVWTELDIYSRSAINSGLDVIRAYFPCVFGII